MRHVVQSQQKPSFWRSQNLSIRLSRHGIMLAATTVLLACLGIAAQAQTAQEMQNAAPAHRPGETEEQKGQRLIGEMLKALGGDAWLNKRTMYREGQTAAFFRGQPTGYVGRFVEYRKYGEGGKPDISRVEFLTLRGVIEPGMKKDLVHLWTANQGYELTFKGVTTLPVKDVTEYIRRRDHSLEEVMHNWIHEPGVVIVAVGADMRDRRPVDKVNIMATNNDTVTIEIDQETHLPLQRSFQWRNQQFKDYDEDEEVYGDWRLFDGVMTPMNMTTYHNGDMAAQNFYTKAHFNQPTRDDLFDPNKLVKK